MASLSRTGFIKCKRFLVGVPVAGKLHGPDEIDTPEGAASSVDLAPAQPAMQPKPEVPFSNLFNGQPFKEFTNKGIDEMVARVG